MFKKTESKKSIVAVRFTDEEKKFLEEYSKNNGYENTSALIRSLLIQFFEDI